MTNTDRRDFIKLTAAAGTSLLLTQCSVTTARTYSRNGKLNVGLIGAGGKGSRDARGVAGENLVALCDVDEKRAAGTFKKYPDATRYHDFREMLDKEDLDAVVISTPDHSHAPAAVMALQKGLHIYVQKPLTHTVHEARVLRELAAEAGVATSMGNQGTGFDGLREAVEVVRSGAIGDVTAAHVWTDRPGGFWKQGLERSDAVEAIPTSLRWDLWLGPAPHRPYNSRYVPFAWRGFWDFGTGALGDMGCHVMNMPFMALDLGAPSAVEAEFEGNTDESPPLWAKVVYEFPQRGALPPATLTWYDGGKKPSADLVPGLKRLPKNGSILVGTKGVLYSAGAYGTNYRVYGPGLDGFQPPAPTLQRGRGKNDDKIYNEWIDDCKGGPRCLGTFDYSCALTETVLLGNVAIRAGEKIQWDSEALRVTNSPKANGFLQKEYARGFGID